MCLQKQKKQRYFATTLTDNQLHPKSSFFLVMHKKRNVLRLHLNKRILNLTFRGHCWIPPPSLWPSSPPSFLPSPSRPGPRRPSKARLLGQGGTSSSLRSSTLSSAPPARSPGSRQSQQSDLRRRRRSARSGGPCKETDHI